MICLKEYLLCEGNVLFNDALKTFYLRASWNENRFSHYDFRAEGALSPNITVIARIVNLGYCICNVSSYGISRSSQCSTTGVTNAVVCVILSVGWCI